MNASNVLKCLAQSCFMSYSDAMPKPRGANIKAIRISRGEKRSSLAGRCGISYKHLYGIEREYEVNQPSIEVLHRIATALDVDIADVMKEEPKPEPKPPARESNPTTHPEPNKPAPPPTPRRRNGARTAAADAERGAA